MSYSVLFGDILTIPADAMVNSVAGNMMNFSEEYGARLFAAAGDGLREAMERHSYGVVSRTAVTGGFDLPCGHVIHAITPRWLTGKAEEFKALHSTYRNVFETARELGCRKITAPFLSAGLYRFPVEDAVHIAFLEAGKSEIETLFVTDSEEIYRTASKGYRKPEIVSYIGWYRDHAIFELDNGRFARVDLRREITDVTVIPYFEACYRVGNNPGQPPLPKAEIARLRSLYEENDW